jgi:hypothetical protein
MKTITLDTNVLPGTDVLECARRLGLDVAVISVTEREVQTTPFQVQLAAIERIGETGRYGEATYGSATYASPDSGGSLEEILKIVSNGSFPDSRGSLSLGERRQLRDALIFEAHVREKRDVFVTNDERAFVRNGRRQALETSFGTRILTVREFVEVCKGRSLDTAV